MGVKTDANKYTAPVDRYAPNNAHAFALQMIGRDKHVLELGCAAGHVTQALVDQGCTVVGIEYDENAAELAAEIAEDVVVTDLFVPENLTKAVAGRDFDVVYAGDVLEHLTDPVGVLREARRALRPGGTVVISIPNVAHIDVKLALLRGHFDYREFGLLDKTHLRFFTRASVLQLLDEAGLELAEIRRVVRAPFETELEVGPDTVSPEVVAEAMKDPEAETYQFVVKAVPSDAFGELARAAQRYREMDEQLLQMRIERLDLEAEQLRLLHRIEALEARLAEIPALEARLREAGRFEEELVALRNTKTFRATARVRRLYGRLRGRG